MEVKATHKLSNNHGDHWLLCATGKTHWFNKQLRSGGYKGWQGPIYGSVEEEYADKERYTLVKLNQFKGNK